MKHFLFVLTCLLFTTPAAVGQEIVSIDKSKQITVTGSADIELEIDQYILEVQLSESPTGKMGERIKLKDIESRFFDILNKYGITKNQIKLNNTFHTWQQYIDISSKHSIQDYQQKRFQIVVDKSKNILQLTEDLYFEGVRSLQLVDVKSNAEQKWRHDLKAMAIKASKDKATYLLEAIGEKIGSVLSVSEHNSDWDNAYRLQLISNVSMPIDQESKISLNTVKLRYEVTSVFEIL